MTIIEDDPHPAEGRDPASRIGEQATRAEDTSKRIIAAISGALDGFVDALDRYDVANEGSRAIRDAGDISRAAAVEGRSIGQTPEMQQVGEGLRSLGQKAGETTHQATGALRERVADVRGRVSERVDNVRERVDHAKEDVKVRAEAVAESGRRARVAPRAVGSELGEYFSAWKRGIMGSLAGMALMGVFAVSMLIVLTIALVVGLNEIVGDPQGTFLVALLYAVFAGIGYSVARSSKARAQVEREEHMTNARDELRHVARPVKDAFQRGRTNI